MVSGNDNSHCDDLGGGRWKGLLSCNRDSRSGVMKDVEFRLVQIVRRV